MISKWLLLILFAMQKSTKFFLNFHYTFIASIEAIFKQK